MPMSHLKVLLHLDVTLKAQSMKDKIDQLGCIKNHSLFLHRRHWEEKEATREDHWCHISDKAVAPGICNEFSRLDSKETNNPIF